MWKDQIEKKKLMEQKKKKGLIYPMTLQFNPWCLQEKEINTCQLFKLNPYNFNCFNLISPNWATTTSRFYFSTSRASNIKPTKTKEQNPIQK
jgi:hypothetical protein